MTAIEPGPLSMGMASGEKEMSTFFRAASRSSTSPRIPNTTCATITVRK